MDNFYSYSVLKYRHSIYLDENINVGVLIYFHNTNRLVFKYAPNLNRIKLIYEKVPDKVISHYLKVINDFTFTYNNQVKDRTIIYGSDFIKNLNIFIHEELLNSDSTSLYFSKTRKVKNEFEIPELVIIDDLFKSNLVDLHFQQNKNLPKEPILLKKFYKNLEGLDFNRINHNSTKFYKDYVLHNKTGVEFKFDYAWQNGTLNLVKPLSFDLKDSRNIADKAYRNLGQFIDLQNEAIEKQLRYDLLIAKPENKKLFKEFDHALNLLSSLKNSSIVLEEEIDSYSKKTIAALIKD